MSRRFWKIALMIIVALILVWFCCSWLLGAGMDSLAIFSLSILAVIGGCVILSLVNTILAHSYWRLLALLPILGLVGVIVNASRNPTNHNLAPFEILLVATIGLAYSVIFLVSYLLIVFLKKRSGTKAGT